MSDYLDCNATTPIDPRVRDEVLYHLDVEIANAASPHAAGRRAKAAVRRARAEVAAVVGARQHEVYFTSGATESNNLAILGLAEHGARTGRRHLVSTQIEHHAVLEPLAALGRRGFQITLVPPGSGGRVDAGDIARALRPDTLLVSVMHVNHETGVIQPIEAVADALARRDLFFHVDAAQGFGKELTALVHRRIDLVSVSGHKIYGPKGIGALIARRRGRQPLPLEPLMFGGGQELGLRPGTLPVALIAGLGKAAALAQAEACERAAASRRIREVLLAALAEFSPVVHGDPAFILPHVLQVSLAGIWADEAIEALAGVADVASGSACTTACAAPSHVLTAMGVDRQRADESLRFSWCHMTRLENLTRMVEVLRSVQSHG